MKELTKYEKRCQCAARARLARSAKNKLPEVIAARFWSKVDVRGPDECWPWKAGLAGWGYGGFRLKGRKINASRFAFILTYGAIPDDIIVRHVVCDNPPCCNPFHLSSGTHKDNADDCMRKGRKPILKGEQHGMHRLTEKEVIEMRRLYSLGTSSRELANKFGVVSSYIPQIVCGNSWNHVKQWQFEPRKPRGENHGCHKLTESNVVQIRNLYKTGNFTMQTLADRFHINISVIHDVVHWKLWKHVKLGSA